MRVNDFVVELADDDGDSAAEPSADSPVVVAETARTIHELCVSEAVMRLDLTDDVFLVFRNASSGELNVVYRRSDGNIGWIDPASPVKREEEDGSVGRHVAGSSSSVTSVGTQLRGNLSKQSS